METQPQPVAVAPPRTGVRVGCLTAFVSVAVMFAGMTLTLAGLELAGSQAEALGELSGRLLLPIGLFSAGAGYAWTRNRSLSIAVALGVVALGAVPPLLPWLGRLRPEAELRELTAAERADPAVEDRGGVRWLVHPALGFEMLEPTGLVPIDTAPIVETAMASAGVPAGTRVVAWGWRRETGDGAVLVMVILSAASGDPSRDATSFEGVVSGAVGSFEGAGATLASSERRGPFDHLLRARHPNGANLTNRVIAYGRGDLRMNFAISSAGTDTADLEPVVLSARALP